MLARYIAQAEAVHRVLKRHATRGFEDLSEACGLASVMLALLTRRLDSLRYIDFGNVHVWNEFDGTIIDITARQFDAPATPVPDAVLVTTTPHQFHLPCGETFGAARPLIGEAVLVTLINEGWYPATHAGLPKGWLAEWAPIRHRFRGPDLLYRYAADTLMLADVDCV